MKINSEFVAAAALGAAALLVGCGGSDLQSTPTSPGGPGAIAAHYVYVMNSTSNNVSAYSINAQTGALIAVANSPVAAGTNPYSMTIAPSGAFAYVSNAGSNDISGYSIAASTGALTALSGSPYAASPHTSTIGLPISPVAIDPGAKFAFVTNPSAIEDPLTHLESNNFFMYTIDPASGALQPAPGSPMTTGGVAPVSVRVDPTGKFVYVANNFPQVGAEGNSISAYSLDAATGTLTAIAGSPFVSPPQQPGTVTLTIDPTGAFVYLNCQVCFIGGFSINVNTSGLTSMGLGTSISGSLPSTAFVTKGSNRYAYIVTADSACAEQINSTTGALTKVNCSPLATARDNNALATDPLGSFVFVTNPSANTVSVFSIDAATGALSPITGSPFPAGNKPAALAVDAKGEVLYVTNSGSNDISAYVVNRTTGGLGTIPGSPFGAGSGPVAIGLL
jgi:6-phosphogluconolactonase